MHTRVLMIVSAILLAVLGLGAMFVPNELLTYAGSTPTDGLPVLVQLLGANYSAFALLNWTAKDSRIGGIYNRPVALGNFAHFAIGALVLITSALRGDVLVNTWIAGLGYGVFAVWFGAVLFGSPVRTDRAPSN